MGLLVPVGGSYLFSFFLLCLLVLVFILLLLLLLLYFSWRLCSTYRHAIKQVTCHMHVRSADILTTLIQVPMHTYRCQAVSGMQTKQCCAPSMCTYVRTCECTCVVACLHGCTRVSRIPHACTHTCLRASHHAYAARHTHHLSKVYFSVLVWLCCRGPPTCVYDI